MSALDYLIHFPMFRHALIAGVAVGTLCSLLSVVVVLNRMAFVAEAISHAGFGGVGTAILLGLISAEALPRWAAWLPAGSAPAALDAVVLVFCLATALGIGLLSRHRHVEADSAIGILLVAAMAWGVLAQNLATLLAERSALYARWFYVPALAPSYEQLLFGSIMSTTRASMIQAVVLGVLVLAVGAAFFKEILFYIFDEPASRVFGVRTGVIHYLLLALVSLTVVLTVRLAGFILVGALLVIPGATARLLSRRLGRVFLIAWAVGLTGTVGGMLLSLQARLSSGACVVGVLCALFGAAFAVQGVMRRRSGAG